MRLKADGRSGKVLFEIGQNEKSLPPIVSPQLGLKRILLPVDFSDCSKKALDYTLSLAQQFDAEVILLHVAEPLPVPPDLLLAETDSYTTKLHEELKKHLSEWRDEIAGKAVVRAMIQIGGPADYEIVQAARDNNVDLIVI